MDVIIDASKISITIVVVIGLVILVGIWVSNNLKEERRKDVNDMRNEFTEIIGPTFDSMKEILEKQNEINQELIMHLSSQSRVIADMSKRMKSLPSGQNNADDNEESNT